MKLLQIKNTGQSPVVIKDFEGYTDFVMSVPPGEARQSYVTDDLMERLEEYLTALSEHSTGVSIDWSAVGQALRADPKGRIDLWLDMTNGNDTYMGQDEDHAVKTVARLNKLIPEEINCRYLVIHIVGDGLLDPVSGDHSEAGYEVDALYPYTLRLRGAPLAESDGGDPVIPHVIITGENETVTVLDNGSGGSIVSDLNGSGEIGLSTATWNDNEHRGYWCKITAAPANPSAVGLRFLVKKNDGTKLYLGPSNEGGGYVDPGAGAEFILERPKTKFSSTAPEFAGGGGDLTINTDGQIKVFVQDLFFENGAGFAAESTGLGTNCFTIFSHIVMKGDGRVFGPFMAGGGFLVFGGDHWDVSGDRPVYEDEWLGVGMNADTFIGALFIYAKDAVGVYWSTLSIANVWYCNCDVEFGAGTKVFKTTLLGSHCPGHGGGAFGARNPGYETEFGGYEFFGSPAAPGIEAYDSVFGLDQSECAGGTVGVRLVRSACVMKTVTGENAVAGCHADAHSQVLLPPDTPPPTLSGPAGAVQLSKDGTTQESTWEAISGKPSTGTITVVAKANLANNDAFEVNGTNFEYKLDGTFTPTGGYTTVDISDAGIVTDVEVAVATAAAINNAGVGVSCPTPTTAVITVNASTYGVAGDTITLSEAVTDAGFLVSGATLAGGVDPVPVSDAEVISKAWVPSFAFTF